MPSFFAANLTKGAAHKTVFAWAFAFAGLPEASSSAPANSTGKTRAMTTCAGEIGPRKIPNLKASRLDFWSLSSTNGETMGTAAFPFLNPIPAGLENARPKLTAKALARRARQRRQIQGMIAASYVLDAFVLLIYARAGT